MEKTIGRREGQKRYEGSRKIKRLIVFTKYPTPHGVKTRLVPKLGGEGAANIHRMMTEHTVATARAFSANHPVEIEIRHFGARGGRFKKWLSHYSQELIYRPQGRGDLGRRMEGAFAEAFRDGVDHALLFGVDIPRLTPKIIESAFNILESSDVALGPAKDGGYYLVGLKRGMKRKALRRLFSGIRWGTDGVLAETVKAARREGLSLALLDRLADVDRPEDLSLWEEVEKKTEAFNPSRISIVIPTLNEAENIAKTIGSAGRVKNVEIIVTDGGSTDDTIRIARSIGAKVIESSPPRGRQLNDGARAASGDVLLFLHADTILPERYDREIFCIMKNPGVSLGAFRLGIGGRGLLLRLVSFNANIRSRLFGLPYGDQGFFLSRRLFEGVGGFLEIPIMEDYELAGRLKKIGDVIIARCPVTTSKRRWERLGVIRTTAINQIVVLGYHLGISPERLSKWYNRKRGIEAKDKIK